jgi:hypothetical protein
MAPPSNSLQQLKLGPGNPKYCALSGCEEIAVDYPCPACSTAPNPDFSGNRLEDVRYCSDAHCKDNIKAHRKTCRDRRWLRDGNRIGEMLHEIFIVARETMYRWVVVKHDEDNTARKFVTKACDKPASEQAFCESDVGPKSKACAMSLHGCVYAMQLGTPFLAYMKKGISARLLKQRQQN